MTNALLLRSAAAALLLALSCPPAWTGEPSNAPPGEVLLKGLKARSIGPAVMGGRISDLAIHPDNPFVFYVGFATSGAWKTVNNGTTFSPIFDDQAVHSIGAIAVAPSDPEVV